MKLRILTIVSVCCALSAVSLRAWTTSAKTGRATAREGPPEAGRLLTPEDRRRFEGQTFLTYPEWFLVYSPDEYADLIGGRRPGPGLMEDRRPSTFPYLEHIGQFWQGYLVLHRATNDDYPFNGQYHVMVMVIGTSTTVEYGLRWAYEVVVGRVVEATRRHGLTAEDKLAAEVAREYADFLNVEPWYRFDYLDAVKRLWTKTGFWGPDSLRKWERKYFLTTEYALKAVYAKILKQGTESAYGVAETITTCVLDRVPDLAAGELPELRVVERFSDGSALVDLPRYKPFTDYAVSLARHDVGFVEIAGNRSRILVSAIVPVGFEDDTPLMLTQPILTRPGLQRIIFHVPVDQLKTTIARLQGSDSHVEHIYDY